MIIKEYAPAKINLFLDVICKREDGYHDLGTVFQTIDAGDTITATLSEDGIISLTYNNPQEYPIKSDLVYKAAIALKNYAIDSVSGSGISNEEKNRINLLGVKLHLEKVMPLGAGLGGGSADAAATLRALNRLWNLNYSYSVLEEIAATLGADVPFLIQGGTAFAEGIGEKLTALEPLDLPKESVLLVATPKDAVPTKDAYAGVSKSGPDKWNQYKQNWKEWNLDDKISQLYNAFETSVFPKHPLVAEMKDKFYELGAKVALMSGSGASVFGIFNDMPAAKKAYNALENISRYRVITNFWHK